MTKTDKIYLLFLGLTSALTTLGDAFSQILGTNLETAVLGNTIVTVIAYALPRFDRTAQKLTEIVDLWTKKKFPGD